MNVFLSQCDLFGSHKLHIDNSITSIISHRTNTPRSAHVTFKFFLQIVRAIWTIRRPFRDTWRNGSKSFYIELLQGVMISYHIDRHVNTVRNIPYLAITVIISNMVLSNLQLPQT